MYENNIAQIQVTFNEKTEFGYKMKFLTLDEFENFESDREVIKVSVVLTKEKE
jgi:hypothetical protein